MPLLYNFDVERPEELLAILAQNLQKRRLEKGLSREKLSGRKAFAENRQRIITPFVLIFRIPTTAAIFRLQRKAFSARSALQNRSRQGLRR